MGNTEARLQKQELERRRAALTAASKLNSMVERMEAASRLNSLLESLREAIEDGENDSSEGVTRIMREHAWDPEDCSSNFRVLANGITARRGSESMRTDAIRGKKAYRTGKHNWEIQWPTDERGSHSCIGVATPQAPLRCLGYTALLGCNDESWGWNIVDKTLWHGGKIIGTYPRDKSFEIPESIYVHLDLNEGQLSFSTKSGNLGIAFSGLPSSLLRPCCAAISATRGNCDVTMKYIEKMESITSQYIPEIFSDEDVPYHFHSNCGDNVQVMCEGKQAKRRRANFEYSNGLVLTREPLKDDVMFEVKLYSKVSRWSGSLMIGIASCGPTKFEFQSTLLLSSRGDKNIWIWKGTRINIDGEDVKKLPFDLDKLAVGDKVGIMKKRQTILFFANGKEIGNYTSKNLPSEVFGAVDIYGRAELVSIGTGTSSGGISRQISLGGGPIKEEVESNDPLSVMLRMKDTVDFLKASSYDISVATHKVAKTILLPYGLTEDRDLRRKFGDHLADLGATRELTRLFECFIVTRREQEDLNSALGIILNTLLNYSDVSVQFGRGLGEAGLFLRLLDDLKGYGTTTITDEKKRDEWIDYKIGILHNCAKVAENKHVFHRYGATSIFQSLIKLDNTNIAADALLALSYIIEEGRTYQLEADGSVIEYITELLKEAVSNDSLRATNEDGSYSALELVMGLGNIAANDGNRVKMFEKGAIQPLIDLIEKGGDAEQECAVNTIWSLSHNFSIRVQLQKKSEVLRTLEKLEKSSNEAIRDASKRALLQIKPKAMPMIQGSPTGLPTVSCEYRKVCENFKNSLNLDEVFFEKNFDMCYCNTCHNGRGDKLFYTRGYPAQKFGVPIGWFRFSLKVPKRAEALNVFRKWHVGFHGTKVDRVEPILHNGILLLPGDLALGGNQLKVREGHFTDDWKPDGFDIKQIFISPSIRYAGIDAYATTSSFQDPETKNSYKVKVAFQVVIRPDCYQVGSETIGAGMKIIDPVFSNEVLEWSTKERTSIIPYGFLVKLEEKKV